MAVLSQMYGLTQLEPDHVLLAGTVAFSIGAAILAKFLLYLRRNIYIHYHRFSVIVILFIVIYYLCYSQQNQLTNKTKKSYSKHKWKIREYLSSFIKISLVFQYIKGKTLPHQNDVNVSFNRLPDRTVTARVSKLAFLQCHVFRKKNLSKLILSVGVDLLTINKILWFGLLL